MRRASILAALAVLAAAPAAQAAYPGVNGRIAFQSDRDGNAEVYSMEADGSDQRNLTLNAAFDGDPDVSPDGARIAFASERDGNREIYVMNADGSAVTRITNRPSNEDNPRWSPDGARIAFDSDTFGNFEILVVGADGTNPQRVTSNPAADRRPVWSPDGSRLAFESNRAGNIELFSVSTSGGGGVRLTNSPGADGQASWSPDGTRIAFASTRTGGGDIYAMDASDGGNVTQLTSSTGGDASPSYSPDGQRIAFQTGRDGNAEIYTMTGDGASETRRTTASGQDSVPSWGRLVATTPPSAGKTATATVVKGTVLIKLPGGDDFAEIDATAAIPIGSTLDTTKGTLRVVTSNAKGGTQSGDFYQGVFTLKQKKGKSLTDLVLSGGSFKSCSKAKKSAHASKTKTIRHLWGKASGKFRTKGKYASATVRGTTWLTSDRCDGTLVKVTKGSVKVRDLRRHTNVVVRARHSYLARKP